MLSLKKCAQYILVVLALIAVTTIIVKQLLHKPAISLFPLEHYSQTIATWINPADLNYDTPLISADMQKKRQQLFLDHYDGELSPWSENGINLVLQKIAPDDLKTMEINVIKLFSNTKDKPEENIGYGENFRPYSEDWIEKLTNNIDLSPLDHPNYQENNRAIAIDNLQTRALPTDDVFLYNFTQAGLGYPFDNLQVSALWAGTPVYIVMETKDHAWTLICSPAFIGWVHSNGIARVNAKFVNTWTEAAKKNLVAITQTETALLNANEKFLLTSYVGSVFPASKKTNTDFKLMIPVTDSDHFAKIETAYVSSQNATLMPMQLTPHNVATILSTLIGRTYGWGNMYFYNDCSAELKNLFTPFGIWLPRHSSNQPNAGKMVDMSAASPKERIEFLKKTGQPLLTIVYIGGHIFLYVGNYPNPHDPSHTLVITYQNVWGLAPKPANRRAVIGKSVFFPLLLSYPEDRSLSSLADKKYFQIGYLNEMPDSSMLTVSGINIETLNHPGALPKDIAAWQSNPHERKTE
ncbi:MAG: SH3 domain-containing protein [Pseudomonadota bacterium]